VKKIKELALGFSDAENFRRKENKELFTRLFVKTDSLDKLCDPGISFLIGEKGTGKTAYAAYFSVNTYKNIRGEIRFIRETEYRKFIALRSEKKLGLSDFVNIWKVIIFLLLAEQVIEHDDSILGRFIKLRSLKSAVNEFYANAFAPEIINAIQFAEKADVSAKLLAEHAQVGGSFSQESKETQSFYQVNLLRIQRSFEEAFRSLKLADGDILFIDGIDVRPTSVPYDDYIDCIKGLANAVWEVNNDFFANIKDSQGRLRVVLLIRPDIFESLELQNQNTKITSNSVLLDWRTDYETHRSSKLFEVVDRLLSAQQAENLPPGGAWDYYFPFDSPTVIKKFPHPSSFIGLLRLSFYRPRDLIRMLEILQEQAADSTEKFALEDTVTSDVKNKYTNYLLGEIKDSLLFYYSKAEYELFLKFFEFLHGRYKYDYSAYREGYSALTKHAGRIGQKLPTFMTSPDGFLQFLYDQNVISYFDTTEKGSKWIRWCFRERTYANMSPKVKAGVTYEIHYGLGRALNLGTPLRRGGKPAEPRDPRLTHRKRRFGRATRNR
jgi:hypothetical protein